MSETNKKTCTHNRSVAYTPINNNKTENVRVERSAINLANYLCVSMVRGEIGARVHVVGHCRPVLDIILGHGLIIIAPHNMSKCVILYATLNFCDFGSNRER